jgi:hypothetical protein
MNSLYLEARQHGAIGPAAMHDDGIDADLAAGRCRARTAGHRPSLMAWLPYFTTNVLPA